MDHIRPRTKEVPATKNKVPFFASLQVKYAVSYLVIFAVVLVLMNTYPVLVSQDLLFASKRDPLKSQTAVMASALMELESLSADQVARVMNMLDSMGLKRILVTDPSGLILYDSTAPSQDPDAGEDAPPVFRYALYREVVSALRGSDVFHSRYADRVFTSTAAMPIVYRGMVIGSIYILEVDQAQGQLLYSLQQNLRSISLVIAAVTLVMSALFSKMLTARIAALLRAIRIVGEGEYGHRLWPPSACWPTPFCRPGRWTRRWSGTLWGTSALRPSGSPASPSTFWPSPGWTACPPDSRSRWTRPR